MSAKINAIAIALEEDISIEEAQKLCAAFKSMRHVLDAVPNVSLPQDWVAQERARRELGVDVLNFINKRQGGQP